MDRKIYNDSYAIELMLGDKRSGKSLLMVAVTADDLKNLPTLKIVCNLLLNKKYFPNFLYLETEKIQEYIIKLYEEGTQLDNTVFLIDEIHKVFDARAFMKKNRLPLTHFLGEIGKRGNILRGTTHFPNLIDLRLRLYVERIFKVKKGLVNKNLEWIECENYNTELSEEENERLYLHVQPIIYKMEGIERLPELQDSYYVKAKKYFDYYESFKLIK